MGIWVRREVRETKVFKLAFDLGDGDGAFLIAALSCLTTPLTSILSTLASLNEGDMRGGVGRGRGKEKERVEMKMETGMKIRMKMRVWMRIRMGKRRQMREVDI
jgi:hypothetical protein